MSILRRYISTVELARLLRRSHPLEDPRALRESRIKTFASTLLREKGDLSKMSIAEVHSQWKALYEAELHDVAYSEAADPGEQCDGELNSWRNDRLKVELDKNHQVPQVSAHEAATRLKRGSS